MIRTVYLHGRLANEFGSSPVSLDISSPVEAVRALSAIHPNFKSEIRLGSYHILVKSESGQFDIGEEDLRLNLGGAREVHIIPVIAGSKNSGMMKVVLGVVLAAGAFFMAPVAAAGGLGATALGVGGIGISYGQIAMIGVALALTGVSQMLSPSKKKDKKDESYVIGNADNVSEQGVPVPIVIGRFLTGSVVMSMGVSTEQIGSDGVTYPGQD